MGCFRAGDVVVPSFDGGEEEIAYALVVIKCPTLKRNMINRQFCQRLFLNKPKGSTRPDILRQVLLISEWIFLVVMLYPFPPNRAFPGLVSMNLPIFDLVYSGLLPSYGLPYIGISERNTNQIKLYNLQIV